MKTNTSSSMGSLHPVIFFAVVYVVALLLSIFICSSLFYSINGGSSSGSAVQAAPVQETVTGNTAVMAASTVTLGH